MQELPKFASHSVFLKKLLEDVLYQHKGDTKKEKDLTSWHPTQGKKLCNRPREQSIKMDIGWYNYRKDVAKQTKQTDYLIYLNHKKKICID